MNRILKKIFNYNEILSDSFRDAISKHKKRLDYFLVLIPFLFIIAGYTFDGISNENYTNFKLFHRFMIDFIYKINFNILPISSLSILIGLFIITLYNPKIIYSFWSTLVVFSFLYLLVPQMNYYTIELIYQSRISINEHKSLVLLCLLIVAMPLSMYRNIRKFAIMTAKNGLQLFFFSSMLYLEITGSYKPFFFLESFGSLFVNSIRLFGDFWDIAITLFISLVFTSLYSKKMLALIFFIRNKVTTQRKNKLVCKLKRSSDFEVVNISKKLEVSLLKHEILPKVGVIVPSFNESAVIQDTIDSLLSIDYDRSSFQIIVVSDGSTDGTVYKLRDKYNMRQVHINQTTNITHHKRAREMYTSKKHKNLIVIDKPNGGKSDALNLGLEYLSPDTKYVSVVDADSTVDKYALRLLSTRAEDDEGVAALTGTILPSEHGEQANFKSKLLENIQLFDYLSSFHGERGALSLLSSILIVPGAFGFFRRDVLMSLKGYPKDVLAEDGLLTLNIHRKKKMKVEFVPEAISYTQVPSTFSDLRKQRMRWFKGLTEMLMSLRKSWKENFKLTFVFLDYLLIEWITPILTPIGICVIIANPKMLTYTTFKVFMMLAIMTPIIQGFLCLMMESSYRKTKISKLTYLPLVIIMSPLMILWRNDALLDLKNKNWGKIKRH